MTGKTRKVARAAKATEKIAGVLGYRPSGTWQDELEWAGALEG